MKEIKTYDSAVNNFNAKLEFKSLPLESWDLFSSKFNTLCKGLEEINALKAISRAQKWNGEVLMERDMLKDNLVVVVTDSELKIVHATENIYGMNGYTPAEIIGKSPKIFQGEATNRDTTSRIRRAIEDKKAFEETILNYRKDGSTYNCWIKGLPILNKKGKLVNFIAFEKEVA